MVWGADKLIITIIDKAVEISQGVLTVNRDNKPTQDSTNKILGLYEIVNH